MTKSNRISRRSAKSTTEPITTQATVKSPATKEKSPKKKPSATAAKREKKAAADALLSPLVAVEEPKVKVESNKFYLDILTNSKNQEIVPAPLAIPLSEIFLQTPDSEKEEIQGFSFQDRAFESEDDKVVEKNLKLGIRLLETSFPTSKDWFNLFTHVYKESASLDDDSLGVEIRDFGLNLAASDPLELFAPEEMDTEGNIFLGPLPVAWLAATLCHGSIHLFFDIELQDNRLSAQTFADADNDHEDFLVPTLGDPSPAWLNLPSTEKQDANEFNHSQRFGEDAQDRCLQDAVEAFSKHLKTKERNMSIKKWSGAFIDASTKGSFIYSSGFGRQLRALGSDLALSAPKSLFMAHEWIDARYLRPQAHAHVWLAAVAVFGPLWLHHDSLLEEVVEDMHLSDDEASTPQAQDMSEDDDSSVSSQATAHAGKDFLQEQKLSGKYRKHQLRYDLRLFVPPSQEADKTMIAMAKKFFLKAKEMDESITLFPWALNSKSVKIKDARSIPEQMGAFKTFFHQAQPKVAGGHVYMRVWLGHDKEPELLHEDLNWWMKNQQHGLYRRSVQAENISGVGWLLYSTKEINCAALQAAIEKRLGNKFEVGCRFKMISLGRRGAVPKENQIKAIHIECDTAVLFDVKVALSKIYASAKNDDYPNGIRLRLVPEINSMISPETRQNVSRLRVRQDNFQKQIERCVSWDIDALDFVDPTLGRSLRDLIMKIESRTVVGQPLFHTVDQTWDQNGYQFGFFPNVDTEARSMIMSLIPFLRHHYQESIVKWFSATAQRRALGADWDPEKGCVKTEDDSAVSWMMTEEGYASFDIPLVAAQEAATRPDPSNLQVAAGAGLIEDNDSVGTFDPQGAAAVVRTGAPAQLVTGSKANPMPRVLPARTGSASNSVDSRSTRSSKSSITNSIVSRMSAIEGSMAKVDKLEQLMNLIASKMDLFPASDAALVPPTPHPAPPDTVTVDAPAFAPVRAATVSQLDYVAQSTSSTVSSPPRPDGVKPLTDLGAPSSQRTRPEIRQSPSATVSADASKTGVGHAG